MKWTTLKSKPNNSYGNNSLCNKGTTTFQGARAKEDTQEGGGDR
jgi:hypothetical protein